MTDISDNLVISWWYNQQDEQTKKQLDEQATCLIEAIRNRDHGLQALGKTGALELLYKLGAWMNKNDNKPA
jgi:hypothetical protein